MNKFLNIFNRQIKNVEPATDDTDAPNLEQVNQIVYDAAVTPTVESIGNLIHSADSLTSIAEDDEFALSYASDDNRLVKSTFASLRAWFFELYEYTLNTTDKTILGAINELSDGKIDKTQNEITKEPTGFHNNDDVIITGNNDRTITLTGDTSASWRGELLTWLISGWTSDVHGTDTTKMYFLYYDGDTVEWHDTVWSFDKLQICLAKYDNQNSTWFYYRETHGLMTWQEHEEAHDNIGTYKKSGGSFSSYTLSSTTASDRRPDISETVIKDEDLKTVIPTLTSKTYTRFRLDGSTGQDYITTGSSDIINLSTNQPYYNYYNGSAWTTALVPSNTAFTVWVYALPVAQGTESQARRLIFVQPQWYTQSANASAGAITDAINSELSRTTQELNVSYLTSSEVVCIGRIVIVYTSSNWTLRNVTEYTGNKIQQIGSQSGNFLTSVNHGFGLKGLGTASNPLYLNIGTTDLGTTSGTIEVDCSLGKFFTVTLSGDSSFNYTNFYTGANPVILPTGAHAITGLSASGVTFNPITVDEYDSGKTRISSIFTSSTSADYFYLNID